jgi:hypothetical protein
MALFSDPLSSGEVDKIKQLNDETHSSTAAYLKDTSNQEARIKARTAAYNLLLELQDGTDSFLHRMEELSAANVLRFLISLDVPKNIPMTGSITADDLASKIGCQKDFLVRLMRVTVATGIFDELEPDTYAHTKRSQEYLDPSFHYFYDIMMGDFLAGGCFSRLGEYYATHEEKSPDDPKHNPYSWSQRMEGHDWHEVFTRTPEMLHRASVAFSGKWQSMPVAGIYPFERLASNDPERTLIVDVGGAFGASMKELKQAHPELKGKIIVQDQEVVIEAIPKGFLPAEIEAQAHDFWTPQPVKHAKAYYMRYFYLYNPVINAILIVVTGEFSTTGPTQKPSKSSSTQPTPWPTTPSCSSQTWSSLNVFNGRIPTSTGWTW